MLAKYIIPMQISADQTLKFMCTLRFAYLHKAAKRGEQPVNGECRSEEVGGDGRWVQRDSGWD